MTAGASELEGAAIDAAERTLKGQQNEQSEKVPALVALGQQIRRVRQSKGISQEDFAALAGLGRSYYGGIERGERNIAALNLMKIASALDVEVGELFPKSRLLSSLLGKLV